MNTDPGQQCDVLIVGGGPAGSSCAARLRQGGKEVVVLDKSPFPRDKTCAGWITPPILRALQILEEDYARENVLQPIRFFRTGVIDGRAAVRTDYDETVSYGIRRCEFDHYLLERCGADLQLGFPLKTLDIHDDRIVVNDRFEAQLVVGAGGHFCPVARRLNPDAEHRTQIVQAQEVEFRMSADQKHSCAVEPDVPELYFCADMRGYGWCFRKGDYLNIGLGREGERRLSDHVARFVQFLRKAARIDFDPPDAYKGHAYRLYGSTKRRLVADRFLLIGDALGLASAQSGEGIRPAIESGLMAADVILGAGGDYCEQTLSAYAAWIEDRFGRPSRKSIGNLLPAPVRAAIARGLLGTKSFTRRVLLDQWFLHADQPDLELSETYQAAATS